MDVMVVNESLGSGAASLNKAVDFMYGGLRIDWLLDVLKNRLLAAVIVLIVAFGLSRLSMYVCTNVLARVYRKTETQLDDEIINMIYKPLSHIILFLGVMFSVKILELAQSADWVISNIIWTLIIYFIVDILLEVTSLLITAWGREFARRTHTNFDDDVLPILSKVVKAVIWMFGAVIVLSQWGIEIAPFLAGLGIAGIAIGFAIQDSLANIFGGVSLILDKVYKVGDKVKMGDGTVGLIHDIGLRSTRIKTFDGDLMIVPNGKIVNEQIYTYAQPTKKTRVVVPFGVAYGVKIDRVKKVVLAVLKHIEAVEEDPEPLVEFVEMADFSLNCNLKFWVKEYTLAYDAKVKATGLIYDALNKAKIDIPFPTRTIYTKKE